MGRQGVTNFMEEAVTLFFLAAGPVFGAIIAVAFLVALIYGTITVFFR